MIDIKDALFSLKIVKDELKKRAKDTLKDRESFVVHDVELKITIEKVEILT